MSTNDIYWSIVCIRSIKSNNAGTFNYALHHIEDNERVDKLKHIYDSYNNGNETIIQRVNDYKVCVPVVVA